MYTSKNTSINKNKPAAIYKKLIKAGALDNKEVLDYGCGRYVEPIKEACREGGALSLMLWDKYWRNDGINFFWTYDVIVCANVLNVIQSDKDYETAVLDMVQLLAPCGTIYIQVYEGDRSEIGLPTKEDCWQRNEKLNTHLSHIYNILLDHDLHIGVTVDKWNGLITIRDNVPF